MAAAVLNPNRKRRQMEDLTTGRILPKMPLPTGEVINPATDQGVRPVDPLHGGMTAREKYGEPATIPHPSFDFIAPDAQQQPGPQSVMTAANMDPAKMAGVTPVTVNDPNTATAKPQTKREQIRAEIERRQGKKFDDKWGFMDTLKGAGIGFLKAFQGTDPRMSIGERLMSALGGAGMGAAQGTFDPNTDEKWGNQMQLGRLQGQHDQQVEMDEDAAKIAKANQEVEGVGIDNVNKRTKDLLATYSADNQIDENEANVLRKLTGLPYSAEDWRKVSRFSDLGIPMVAREGEEAARVDSSRPINPMEIPKTRSIDGQDFNVSDEKAFPVAGNVAVGNANRQQSASQFQTTQANQAVEKDYKDEKEYQDDVRSHGQRIRKAQSDKAAAQRRLDVLAKQLETATTERASLASSNYNTAEIDKRIGEIESRKATAEGEISGADVLINEPAPKKLIRPKKPGTSKGGKNENIGTVDDYQRALQKIKR
ncbi:MAG: hypothetical protein ABL984_08745 [Pyrinomonadaceae bacterium]